MANIKEIAAKAGLDWFILALIGMVGLAYLFPGPGVYDGPISLGKVASYGVSVIFFFYGLRLSPEKLRAGLKNWRLHVTIHTTTFLLFPAIIYGVRFLFPGAEQNVLWLGIFFLATLPSTVSSSVVMVSIAGGNIPAAIFNASISSLIGVFITPLWMGLVLTATEGGIELGEVILKLVLQVVLPVALGIGLHKRIGGFAEKKKGQLRYFDQAVILLIIYTAFCKSFTENLFDGFSALDLFLLAMGMLTLFFTIYIMVHFVGKALGFNREDMITAQFCGSKKSLVHGTVMSKVLFPDSNITGIILMPLMLYHALQLIVAGVIAQRMAKQSIEEKKIKVQLDIARKSLINFRDMKNIVIVDGDLEVTITNLHQGHSVQMLEGLPFKRLNDNRIAEAVQEAKRLTRCPVVHLIEPTITPIPFEGKYPFGTPERLPYIRCTASLHYFTAIRDKSKHGADLIVVWFQDDFAFPIENEILEKFKAIPFREICWEYDY